MNEEAVPFFPKIRKGNNEGLLEITVDKSICDYLGLQIGDKVKVWIKKV